MTRCLVLLITFAVLGCATPAWSEVDNWKDHEGGFWRVWVINKQAPISKLGKSRAKRRRALLGLHEVPDGRAIPMLIKAQKQQRAFVDVLTSRWAKRRAAWLKLESSMRPAIESKRVAGLQPDLDEQTWINEELKLAAFQRDIALERSVTEDARTAMARILAALAGRERATALKRVVSGVSRGQSPDERDFVRLLGECAGDDVTQLLVGFAHKGRPPLAQAALEALGRQHAEGNIALLRGFLTHEHWQIRAAAIGALGYYQSPQVVDVLIEAAVGEPGVLQRHCFTALHRILGEVIPGDVGAWTAWWATHRARFEQAWSKQAVVRAPVLRRPKSVMVRQGQGHTTFYGIQTNSKHIVFVIDISGSMAQAITVGDDKGKPRIEVAKVELKRAIRTLSDEDGDERGVASFNIVAYAGNVRAYKSGKMMKATKSNKDASFEWIDKLRPLGSTAIYDAIESAFEIISDRNEAQNALKGADTFFLMTDGKPTAGKIVDPDMIRKEVARMNATRQVVIHTVGVGQGHNKRFLEQLAAENRGEYIAR